MKLSSQNYSIFFADNSKSQSPILWIPIFFLPRVLKSEVLSCFNKPAWRSPYFRIRGNTVLIFRNKPSKIWFNELEIFSVFCVFPLWVDRNLITNTTEMTQRCIPLPFGGITTNVGSSARSKHIQRDSVMRMILCFLSWELFDFFSKNILLRVWIVLFL